MTKKTNDRPRFWGQVPEAFREYPTRLKEETA